MDFTLMDIDELCILGKFRLDRTDVYDISYYEKYISDNITMINELVSNVQNNIMLIRDDKTKERISKWEKMFLEKAFEKNLNKNPKRDYENSNYKNWGTSDSFFGDHKYFKFIEADIQDTARSYAGIINFMNKIYGNFKACEYKGDYSNQRILYNMFEDSKNCLKGLGVHCPNPEYLLEVLSGDLYDNPLDMNLIVEEDNTLSSDVVISSLPYTVTLPTYNRGISKYEYSVTNPKPIVFCNKSYLEKSTVR